MNTLTYTSRKKSQRDGFTLVEVMVSVAIIVIVALGTLSFQYQTVKHSRSAEAQVTAARLGQLLLEDWKSTFVISGFGYDATSLGLGFVAPVFPETGDYKITLDNQTFYLQRAQQLVNIPNNPDPVAGITLQQLSVTVKWRKDGGNGAVNSSDPTLTFTTFVRRDS